MSKRLEGGYLAARPTWSLALGTPGVWGLEQQFFRNYQGLWPLVSPDYDPYFESVSLLVPMNGANLSTTFVDRSLSNFAVTTVGDAKISTAQSKFGGSSGLFDGTGDYLTVSVSATNNIVANFTAEAWVRLSAMPTSDSWPGAYNGWFVVVSQGTPSAGDGWCLMVGQTVLGFQSNDALITSGVHNMVTNTWYHIAATRDNGTLRLFVNGSVVSTTTHTSTLGGGSSCYIGSETGQGAYFNGYMNDVRVTKGVARYTSAFSLPVQDFPEGSALYDPYFPYVTLLLRCNGADNSATFTDSSSSNLTVTTVGNAKISTANWRFGLASGYFDGTGDYLDAAASAAIQGTENFTFEAWIYPESVTGSDRCIYETRGGSGFVLFINTSGYLQVFDSVVGLASTASTTLLVANRWQHIALVGTGSTKTYYVNGTAAGTFTLSSLATATRTRIGARNDAAAAYIGYMDDIRVTRGVARYNSNFRPLGPYSTSGNLVDPYLNSSVLLLPMTGDNNTTSFFDRSNNFLRLTEVGNARISTSISKFGDSSGYFDGTGDYLSLNDTSLRLGTNDFTIECWVYILALSGYSMFVGTRQGSVSTTTGWSLGTDSTGAPLFYSNAFIATGAAGIFKVNQWYHVAVTRQGTSVRLFVNGSQVATGTNSQDFTDLPLYVGAITSEFLNGYIDDLRITKGFAHYTTPFVIPESSFNNEAFNDPHYNNVSLLLHMDGANNSTTFTDSSSSPRTVIANGGATVSTAQSKFGGASAYFNGTSDSLSFADPALGTGDFTIEMWFKTTSSVQYAQLIGNESAGYSLLINNASSTAGDLALYLGGLVCVTTGTSYRDDAWHHIAVTRSGTGITIWIDGVSKATATNAGSFSGQTNYVGRNNVYTPRNFVGYIDELRITKGVARYTSNFLPPTLPFYNTTIPTIDPSFSSVSLLLHMDGTNGSTTFTDSSVNALAVTANGNAQISTAQSKFGGASGYFDGSGDFLSCASSVVLGFGAGDFTIDFWWYPTRNVGNETIIDTRPSDSGTPLVLGKSGAGAVRCFDGTTIRTGGTMTLNTWNHVAWSRSGTSNQVYLNGISVISFTNGFDAGSSRGLTIGSNVLTSAENCQGYIDDLRITKGVARYTSNFYIPRAAFPDA